MATGGYLIDTNVISELRRREPAARVVEWFEQRRAGQLYLSVLSLGEIRRGVEKLEAGERQHRNKWLLGLESQSSKSSSNRQAQSQIKYR